jgi:hypothetical protein
MEMKDKYLVIWWDEDEVHVSKPMLYKDAHNMVKCMDEGRLFYQEEDGRLDDGRIYKEWSKIITKYQPVLEKDLWNEL